MRCSILLTFVGSTLVDSLPDTGLLVPFAQRSSVGKVPIRFWLNRQRSAHESGLSGTLLSACTTNLLVKPSSCKQRDSMWARMGGQQRKHRTSSMLSHNQLFAVHPNKALCSSPHEILLCCTPTNTCAVSSNNPCAVFSEDFPVQ